VTPALALRAELRRVSSTRLWWGLLVPVALVAVLVNLFGGLLGEAVAGADPEPPLLLASVAFTLTLTVVFAAVYGTVSAAGEFRHRTVTTAYLTAGSRGRVLAAKLVAGSAVGVLYAVVAAVLGVVAGVAGQGGRVPGLGALLAVTAVGAAVAALWGAFGAALGTLLGNQVGALVALLVYLQIGELVLAAVLNNSGSAPLARLTPYLPGNAGDVAIYDLPAQALAGRYAEQVVEELAGVTAPPSWWVALLVLAAWVAAATLAAWQVGGRRDVT
jgi:ABC-type transport system involved in multi-copper enzyme maturation permease subunit